MRFHFYFPKLFHSMANPKPNAAPRFYGAFTGGFSAGYFNTVGSEEGFQPKTFVSSRNNRANRVANAATDYMDEEDGLLGGALRSKETYDTFDEKASTRVAVVADKTAVGSSIPGPVPKELIASTSQSVAKEILKKMGWKAGHGIGAPVLYTVPQQVGSTVSVPVRERERIVIPPPKSDTYGIGYLNSSALTESVDDSRVSSRQRTLGEILQKDSKTAGSGMMGASRSVRYMNDDDDDNVYESYINPRQHASMYEDTHSDSDGEETGEGFGRVGSAPRKSDIRSSVQRWIADSTALPDDVATQRCPTDGRPLLPGFLIGSVSQLTLEEFPLPALPEGFQPYSKPRFIKDSSSSSSGVTKSMRLESADDAITRDAARANRRMARRLLFSDSASIQQVTEENKLANSDGKVNSTVGARVSVFEYLSEESSRKLRAIAAAASTIDKPTLPIPEPPAQALPSTAPAERPYLASETLLKTTFAGLSTAFKDRFVSSSQPAAATTEQSIEGLTSSAQHAERVAQQLKATEKASVGEVARPRRPRTSTLWIPDALLCKRFNVPAPDIASSSQVAAARSQRSAPDEPLIDKAVNQLLSSTASSSSEPRQSPPSTDAAAHGDAAEGADEYTGSRPRPSLSLFKSIFEDSDSDEEGEKEEGHAEKPTDTREMPRSDNSRVEKPDSEELPRPQPERVLFRKPVSAPGDGKKKAFPRAKPVLVREKFADSEVDPVLLEDELMSETHEKRAPRQSLLSFAEDYSISTGVSKKTPTSSHTSVSQERVPLSAEELSSLVQVSSMSATSAAKRQQEPSSSCPSSPPAISTGEPTSRAGYPTLTSDMSFSKARSLLETSLGGAAGSDSDSSSDGDDSSTSSSEKKHKSKKLKKSEKKKHKKKDKKKDKKEKKAKKDKKADNR